MIKYYILFGLFLLSISTGFSQKKKSFPKDEAGFIKEASKLISSYDKKKGKQLTIDLQNAFSSGYFTENDKQDIIRFSNLFLKRRAMAHPHFDTYFNTLLAFERLQIDKSSYSAWHSFLIHLIGQKKITLSKLTSFLKTSYAFISEKSLYHSVSLQWTFSGGTFSITSHKNQLIIHINNTTLTNFAKKDSIKIYNTSGDFNPFTYTWNGLGGVVKWDRQHLDSVFATLHHYSINLKKTRFTADSAELTYPMYFKHPIFGILEHKTTPAKALKNHIPSYPRFKSYKNRFKFPQIFKNIDLEGGFYLKGEKIFAKGDKAHKAKLFIYYKDTLRLMARSNLFILKQKAVIGERTEVAIYLSSDSIFHPGLLFKYNDKRREVELIRNNKGLSKAPYSNTYHKVSMDVPEILWNIDNPQFLFTNIKGSTQHFAKFESLDFFRMSQFMDIQKMDDINPLAMVDMFTKEINSDFFYDTEFSKRLKASIQATRHYLLNIAYLGFLNYDIESGIVIVNKKLHDYINARLGKKDYDVIQIFSEVPKGNNAEMSLLNYFIKIHGVQQIQLSDSQNVTIFPKNRDIILKKNRDFAFHGKIRAGMFLFAGSNFSFNYDIFKITMPDIRYMKMQVLSNKRDKNGRFIPVIVKNKISDMSGELIIDAPNDKSGKMGLQEYPKFKSFRNSYVYFDSKNIQNGVYKRDKFYFQVFPYEMDSLDNVDPASIKFKGHFTSAGIFPDFDETLTIQDDYSLGFKRKTSASGSPIYGGKATFTNTIKLSNQGLRGDGKIDYLTSTSTSNDFIFYPDSTKAESADFINRKKTTAVEYPSVQGKEIQIFFMPYKDKLLADNTNEPFSMIDDNSTLKGSLTLTPDGMFGKGKMEFNGAELLSNDFAYKSMIIDADTSNFNLKTLEQAEFSFKTNNVNAHVDFIEQKALFKSNGEASYTELPQNKYICYMDQFTWYMQEDNIEMSASKKALDKVLDTAGLSPIQKEDVQLEGAKFISIHPKQDSLNFKAPSAKYDLKHYVIYAHKVKLIHVADATVYPKDGEVIIRKNAKMDPLLNTKIIANNVSRYHTLYDCTTKIYARRDYMAKGKYNYVDETGHVDTIYFSEISVDSSYQTYAKGKIGIADNFTLSPDFAYTGDVTLHANNKFLDFDGYTRISHKCETLKSYWIKFAATIDPHEIYIPVGDTMTDINNNLLYNGYFLAGGDSAHIYTTFLSKKEDERKDKQFFSVSGYLFFDKELGKYKISNKDKLQEFSLPGQYMELHHSICNSYGEGKLNLGLDFGQVKTEFAGNVATDLAKHTTDLDVLMNLNFFIDKSIMKLFADDLLAINTLEPVDLNRSTFSKGLAELVGKDMAEELMSQYAIKGEMKKIPKELKSTLFINDLKLTWVDSLHAYITTEPIGIGNVLDKQINRYVDGLIVFNKRRGGDILTMYFKLSDQLFYFFEYGHNIMRIFSSNQAVMEAIRNIKFDDRKLKHKKGEKPFSYTTASPVSVKRFLKKYTEKKETPEKPNNNNADDSDEGDDNEIAE